MYKSYGYVKIGRVSDCAACCVTSLNFNTSFGIATFNARDLKAGNLANLFALLIMLFQFPFNCAVVVASSGCNFTLF